MNIGKWKITKFWSEIADKKMMIIIFIIEGWKI
jgi:hypothetical protein